MHPWLERAWRAETRAGELERELDEARAALQHFVECADTPLMRDVLAERDAAVRQRDALLREALDWIEAKS